MNNNMLFEDDFFKSTDFDPERGILMKGRKGLPVGTVKEWKGRKYIKTGKGWRTHKGEGGASSGEPKAKEGGEKKELQGERGIRQRAGVKEFIKEKIVESEGKGLSIYGETPKTILKYITNEGTDRWTEKNFSDTKTAFDKIAKGMDEFDSYKGKFEKANSPQELTKIIGGIKGVSMEASNYFRMKYGSDNKSQKEAVEALFIDIKGGKHSTDAEMDEFFSKFKDKKGGQEVKTIREMKEKLSSGKYGVVLKGPNGFRSQVSGKEYGTAAEDIGSTSYEEKLSQAKTYTNPTEVENILSHNETMHLVPRKAK